MIHIIIKDLKLFVNDKRGLIMYLFLPLLLITIFVLAYSNLGGEYDPINIAVIDNDGSIESKELIDDINSVNLLKVIKISQEEANNSVKSGKLTAVLYIHKNTLDSITKNRQAFELFYDLSNEFEFNIIKQIVIPKMVRFAVKNKIKNQLSTLFYDHSKGISNYISNETDSLIVSAQKDLNNIVEYKSVQSKSLSGNLGLIQGVAGTAVLMLLFSVRSIGAQIIEDKEDGTFIRTMFSVLTPNAYLTGKLLSSLIIGMMQIFIMLFFSYLAFGFDLFYNLPALALITFLTAISCASFSILIGVLVTSRAQLQSLSTAVILLMSAIGGSMIPSFIMPDVIRNLSVLSINYWSIQGYYDIYLRGCNLSGLMPRIYALSLFTLIFISLSFFLFNRIKISLLTK